MNFRQLARGEPACLPCVHAAVYNVDDEFYCDDCGAKFDLVPDPPVQEFRTP